MFNLFNVFKKEEKKDLVVVMDAGKEKLAKELYDQISGMQGLEKADLTHLGRYVRLAGPTEKEATKLVKEFAKIIGKENVINCEKVIFVKLF